LSCATIPMFFFFFMANNQMFSTKIAQKTKQAAIYNGSLLFYAEI